MSVVSLPAELKTRKVQSLKGEERKLVEELLADKFDIKEEVVPDGDDSFREVDPRDIFVDPRNGYGNMGPGSFRCTCGPAYATRCLVHEPTLSDRGNGGYGRPQARTWKDDDSGHIRVAASITGMGARPIRDAIQLLDMNNIRRDSRKIVVSHGYIRQLMVDPDFNRFFDRMIDPSRYRGGREEVIGRMFGCEMVVQEGVACEVQGILH